jgi:hypothetical protein
MKMGGEKNLTKGNKRKESKINVLAHELLASTLSYLMLAPWWYTNPSNTPLRIAVSAGLRWICTNHLKRFGHKIAILTTEVYLITVNKLLIGECYIGLATHNMVHTSSL